MDQRRQSLNNLVSNVLTLGISVAVGIFYTPYLVRSLGIAAYGIVPLALIINQYISVITGSLTGSLTRFYAVALQQGNYADASKYLSSACLAIGAIVCALSPVFFLIVMKIDRIFNIPPEYVPGARILFSFTLLSFAVSLFSSLLNVTLYALNRLDLMNMVKIVRVGFKVLCIVFFFEALQKDVSYIGYANFLTEAADLALSFSFYRITTQRHVRISAGSFERKALFSMLAMTGWVIVHQLGDTGLYRIDTVMVNIFWNTRESGILGALSEFGGYVMALVSVIGSLFGPLILIAYSNEDHHSVKKLAMDNSLFVGAATALIVGSLIGFSKPIIGLWLGREYAEYSPWFILKLVTLPFYTAAGVYSFVYKAWNFVMFPALFTLGVGAVNLVVSYAICSYSNGSEFFIGVMLGVAALSIIVQSYGLNAYSFWKLYPDLGRIRFLWVFLKIAVIVAVTSAVAFAFTMAVEIQTVLQLGAAMAAAALICVSLVFFTMFDRKGRSEILHYFRIAEQAS